MKQKTKEALLKSIAHWERMRDNPTSKKDKPFAEQCALCRLFLKNELEKTCIGCPIYESTGQYLCDSTPYIRAYDLWCDIDCFIYEEGEKEIYINKFKLAAQREIDFLKSLLPEDPN